MWNIPNSGIPQPLDSEPYFRCQNVRLALTSSTKCLKVHFSTRKSRVHNYLGPFIGPLSPYHGRKKFVDTIPNSVDLRIFVERSRKGSHTLGIPCVLLLFCVCTLLLHQVNNFKWSGKKRTNEISFRYRRLKRRLFFTRRKVARSHGVGLGPNELRSLPDNWHCKVERSESGVGTVVRAARNVGRRPSALCVIGTGARPYITALQWHTRSVTLVLVICGTPTTAVISDWLKSAQTMNRLRIYIISETQKNAAAVRAAQCCQWERPRLNFPEPYTQRSLKCINRLLTDRARWDASRSSAECDSSHSGTVLPAGTALHYSPHHYTQKSAPYTRRGPKSESWQVG